MTQTVLPRSRLQRLLRWMRYLLTGLLGFLLLLASVGAVYEAIESHRDRRFYPPSGRLVDIGGYRLHLVCAGAGSPAVILEAGGGNPLLSWYKVQPGVAQFTTVCSYDWAGLGWSDPSPQPRTARVIARELHALLHNAGVTGPYVLVGHSLGGMDVRMFAHEYPSKCSVWCSLTPRTPTRATGFRPKPNDWPPGRDT